MISPLYPYGDLWKPAIAILPFVLYRRGLRSIPGPFLASFSNTDRIITAASGKQFLAHIKYHQKKYGNLVRVGPNHVSFSDADLIPLVYGITSKFYKSDFYTLFDAKSPKGPIPTVFSIRDEKAHKALKRPVANAYSMSALVELEPMTDTCITILQDKLDSFKGKSFDFGEWLQFFSFDVITSITFSNRLGFMEQEKDVSGIIDAIEGRLAYNCVIGEIPAMNRFLLGSALVASFANCIPALARLNSARYIVDFAAKQLDRYKTKDKSTDELRDMLARFKRSRDGEEVMSDKDLLSHASSNIFAGSDTTAISLRSMFYYLCKNPRCYRRVMEEIDEMEQNGLLSEIVTFSEANKMKYLQACMKEAMRMHPAVGQLLERVVPEGGVTLSGVWLPQGTIVGVNPWVPSRDRLTYGDDADIYRPERWLEADAAQLKLMERNFLAFGSGARTCLGKNVSLLEMSKVVPQILRNYVVELSNPDAEWNLTDHWFVKQTGVICNIKKRQK
ncbi:putative P450 monooxygenase [Xylogone sp. PMI_703]|nr:putative P450 monooxygenase [Xylogone sp. PMI_703]